MLVSETAEIRKVEPIFLTATDTAVALATDAEVVDELIADGEILAATIRGRLSVSYASLVAFRDRKIAEAQK